MTLKGKKIRKSKTVKLDENLTEKQKDRELNKLSVLFEKEVESGTYLDGEKISLEEFIEKWLEDYAEKQLAPSTLKSYKSKIKQRIIPALGHIKLSKLQPHHLMTFYNNLTEESIRLDTFYQPSKKVIDLLNENISMDIAKEIGLSPKTYIRLRNGEKTNYESAEKVCNYYKISMGHNFKSVNKDKKLSGKTIKHHHNLISAILSTAVKWGVITENIANRVDTPKVEKPKTTYYEDFQVIELFKALENEPLKYKTIIYLTIDAGLRAGEVAGLEWKDISFESSTVSVRQQRQYVHGYGVITKSPKTDSGIRTITISQSVMKLLKSYKKEYLENKIKCGSAWTDSDFVFTHEMGEPMHPHRPYQFLMRVVEKNDLPKITFHALRHTNASLLIAEGIDIVTLSGRLGHANKSVTLNTYSHIIQSKEQEAANKLDDFYNRFSDDI